MTGQARSRKILGWMGKILLGILVLLVALVAIGLIRESMIRSAYHADYPAPGSMVTVDHHDLHLHCVGAGKPTVVLEADLDQYGSLSWHSVQGEVATFTRACSYDRAGIMWSEAGPRPRDGETIAAELRTALDNAGEEGPYLLAGHGFGGAYARIFAGQNRDDVCGMVLVESSHPEMLARFEETGVAPEIPDERIRPLITLLSRLGTPGRYKGNPYNLTAEVYDPVQAFLPESSMAWFDEKVAAPDTLAQAGRVSSLGDLPLIVIATAAPPVSIGDHGQVLQDLWLELQQELLLLSENSEIRKYEVGHYPQLQSPGLVIDTIRYAAAGCEESSN